MADDGLFFRAVAWLNPRTRVPVVAIVMQSVWTIVIALSGRYEQILNYVIPMDFLFFGLTATTIFIFRRRAKRGTMNACAGYRVPGHPVTTVAFVAICWWIVGNTIYRYPGNSLVGFCAAAGGHSGILVLEAGTIPGCRQIRLILGSRRARHERFAGRRGHALHGVG